MKVSLYVTNDLYADIQAKLKDYLNKNHIRLTISEFVRLAIIDKLREEEAK